MLQCAKICALEAAEPLALVIAANESGSSDTWKQGINSESRANRLTMTTSQGSRRLGPRVRTWSGLKRPVKAQCRRQQPPSRSSGNTEGAATGAVTTSSRMSCAVVRSSSAAAECHARQAIRCAQRRLHMSTREALLDSSCVYMAMLYLGFSIYSWDKRRDGLCREHR